MGYVKSLRFKLMLLCVVPMFILACLFIAHSYIIAFQLKDQIAALYLTTLTGAGADDAILQAVQGAAVDTGWIAGQWVAVFLAGMAGFYLPLTLNIKKIIVPIREISGYSSNLAEGDIQIEVAKNRTDEIGIMQESFKRLVDASRQQANLISGMADGDISGSYTPRSSSDIVGHSLVQMLERNNAALTQVSQSAERLTASSLQIADSSQLLASGATQQSATVSELSESIKDVALLINNNAELVAKAAGLGDTIMTKAQKSNHQMEQMLVAVKEISDASLAINKVMKVIDDIAFQTNILALNAAVEAARAGQHGKGFAVVADEVRNLASKSAEAARDTGSLIANSIEKSQLGAQIADETAGSLSEIIAEISESSRIIADVAESYERQDQAVGQINIGMQQVSQVVQQNSASAEQSAAASVEMSEQSKILHALVSQFKLRNT